MGDEAPFVAHMTRMNREVPRNPVVSSILEDTTWSSFSEEAFHPLLNKKNPPPKFHPPKRPDNQANELLSGAYNPLDLGESVRNLSPAQEAPFVRGEAFESLVRRLLPLGSPE